MQHGQPEYSMGNKCRGGLAMVSKDSKKHGHSSDKLVEAIEMPFQDALPHEGWSSAPHVGRGDVQSRSAAHFTLRSGLVHGKPGIDR